jgi:hypothetical protein
VNEPIRPRALADVPPVDEEVAHLRHIVATLHERLSTMTEDRDRWVARMKKLEAERDAAIELLCGRRRP